MERGGANPALIFIAYIMFPSGSDDHGTQFLYNYNEYGHNKEAISVNIQVWIGSPLDR